MLTYGNLKSHIVLALGGQPSIVSGMTRDQRIAEIVNQSGQYLFTKAWRFRERTSRALPVVAQQNWVSLPTDVEDILALISKAGLGWRVELTTPEHMEIIRNMAEPALMDGTYYATLSRPWAQAGTTTPLADGSGLPDVRLELYPTPQSSTSDALTVRYRSGWQSVSSAPTQQILDQFIIPVPAYAESLLIAYARAFAMAYEDEGLTARLLEIDNGPIFSAAAIKDGIQQRDYGRLLPNRVSPFRREYGVQASSGAVLTPVTATSNIRWRGTWDANNTYAIGDVVRYGDKTWICEIGNTNDAPPSGSWSLLAEDGTDGAAGQGVPSGGSQYQVLAKNTASNYDTVWMYPALTSASNFILSNVTMSSASTFYDCGSVTLAAGTWLLAVQAVAQTASGSAGFDIRIRNITDSSTVASNAIANPRATAFCGGSAKGIATIAATKTFRCQVACVGSTAGTVYANAPLGDANCTGISAVRIA